MKNAIEWLLEVPTRHAARTFMINARTGEEMTFGEYHESGCRVAAELNRRGLGPGDRLALMLNNSLDFTRLYLGCLYARVVAIPINPVLGPNEVDYIVRTSRPSAFVISGETGRAFPHLDFEGFEIPLWQLMDGRAEEHSVRGTEPWDLRSLNPAEDYVPLQGAHADDLLAIVYTSGTTARPKGVVHRIGNLVDNARLFSRRLGIDAGNRFYATLSMTYMGGYFNLLILPYVSGASVVLAETFDARAALSYWEPAAKHQANTLWLVPTIISILMEVDRGQVGEAYCREQVRLALVGTAPLAAAQRARFEERYGVRLYENYGLSETLFISTNAPSLPRQEGCVGRVLPGVEVSVLDEHGAAVPYGLEGEIVVCTPHMMEGYWDAETGAPDHRDRTEWLPTGDLGVLMQTGDLFITGRAKDLIIRGGINISPASIENVMLEHSGVLECAVVGVPHPLYGEDVAAVIRLKDGVELEATRQDLQQDCRQRLGHVKQPSAVLEIDDFPKGATGKIDKGRVREFVMQKMGLHDAPHAVPHMAAAVSGSRGRSVVDLSYPIHEGMTTFPVHWHPVVEVTMMGRHGIEDRETRKLVLGTHTGTHFDAPRHFIPDGATVDQISLDVLVGPAVVVDLTDMAEDKEISWDILRERLEGECPERLVLRFDWSRNWGGLAFYQGHSYLSEDAAMRLADGGMKLLAMDTPMPDNPANGRGTANDSPIHKILLGRGVILVEYLCNLDQLAGRNIELVVAPLNILGADGAPARCLAIERHP